MYETMYACMHACEDEEEEQHAVHQHDNHEEKYLELEPGEIRHLLTEKQLATKTQCN